MTAAVAGSAAQRAELRPHLAPVPDSDPPFDPEVDPSRGAPPAARGRRSVNRSGLGGSTAVPLTDPMPATTRVTCEGVPSWSADADVGVRRTATAQLPPAPRAAQVFATALVEVLAGRRPVGQLRVHTAPTVFAGLVNRTLSELSAPAHVLSVRLGQPADGVAEVSATVRTGPRVRAIAFRMEGLDGRWRVTALDIG